MARARELPHSFEEALRVAEKIISANHELVARNLVSKEAEQIVIAAYRATEMKSLSRLELFTRISDRFPEAAAERVLTLAGLRAEGRPLQYAIGYQAFLDHEYEVNKDVLIPRPETEALASLAIERLKPLKPALGLEVGLGSGAISIELLVAIPELKMIATELSKGAREVALRNAERILGRSSDRLEIREAVSTQVLEPFLGAEKADFLISNPPYLAVETELDRDVLEHEPHEALFAPKEDPYFFYRKIAEEGQRILKPSAAVYLEIPHERAEELAELYRLNSWNVQAFNDLTGRPRILFCTLLASQKEK